ncbi:signal recognition particle-docking protein FtsY [Marinospirillum sp. MEB164]|uniref:Signal recognition particle receptor FtsY n=1 Tax=Marinospirillum alkalitolerans TaxID=3123374 RepID=A0ABW8PTJ1_9GAMM
MLGLFKRKKKEAEEQITPATSAPATESPNQADAADLEQPTKAVAVSTPSALDTPSAEPSPVVPQAEPLPVVEKKGLFARLKAGLAKTRSGLAELFLGKRQLDDELMEELETRLLMADVGMKATQEIIATLTQKVERKQLQDAPALFEALKEELKELLRPIQTPLAERQSQEFTSILIVGVNGVGKTTTIGKLAKRYQQQGNKVMLAAGDTFRAAAVEQLKIWGERNQVPVIAQHTGADSASVIFDALQAAQARQMNVLLADTAGRLHNKSNLMEELAKVRRVMQKVDTQAPHETWLVLDAATGQNALAQARQFHQSVPLTGLILTKLDGTAKGGIVFALAKELGLPVRFIGVGEQVDDLRVFDADQFVDALLAFDEQDTASA